MLMQREYVETEIPETLKNLMALRDMWPHLEQMEREGRLDLDIYESPCATYRCVLGEYAHHVLKVKRVLHWCRNNANNHFDLSINEQIFLFSSYVYGGGLAERKAFLDRLIAERIREHVKQAA